MRTIQEILKKSGYRENQLEYFLANCYIDYIYFAENVLGFKIADYHREWLGLLDKHNRLCIIAFRGSGKTYFMAGYYLWKSIFQGPRETLIISKREGQAKEVLKIVKGFLQQNELLKQFIPESREATWKATELELANRSVFYCKPYNEGVRTWHPDDVLCDEVGEYEDKSIFHTAVLGTIQLKKGSLTAIGTPKSAADLLAELKENGEYMCKEYPAELDGKAIWPHKYTTLPHDTETQKSLIKTKNEMGELAYAQEYMLLPMSSANSLFPYELVSKSLVSEDFLPYGKKDEKYYIGYDVATSPKGDWTVMTVLSASSAGKRLVKAYRFRADFIEQERRLKQLYQDFRPVKVNIDATGMGEKQAIDLQRQFGNLTAIKITYDDKLKMLLDLRQEFERTNITLPNKKETEAYGFTQYLVKELNDMGLKTDLRAGQTTRAKFFSGKYDDCVMSLALANKATQNPFGEVSFRGIE